jgi:predicted 2-oxoglutarate/Fe(II)-dependent dioxygenase YbiX
MLEGSYNSEHMDNYYLDGDIIKQRPNHPKDVSGLLYLSESYEGGYLSFTSQGFKIKPKPGSLVIFEGDDKKPHEVTKVESGTRNLIVSFYVPVA